MSDCAEHTSGIGVREVEPTLHPPYNLNSLLHLRVLSR
jgi:hypothetical protein